MNRAKRRGLAAETYKLNSTMGVNKRMEGLQKIEQECIALIKDLNKEESCVVEHNLKVIRKELKIKGDYGTYEVHDDFLVVGGNTTCKSKEDIKSYIEKEVSELQKQIDVLKASANEMFAVFEQFV